MLTLFRVGLSICFSSDSLVRRFTHVEPSFSLVSEKFPHLKNPLCEGLVSIRAVSANIIWKQFSAYTANTRPRRSFKFREVFIFCEPVNNLLISARLSTNSLHCCQIFSATATWTNVLVGIPINFPFTRKVFDRSAHKTHDWHGIKNSSRQNDVTRCDFLQEKQVEFPLPRARFFGVSLFRNRASKTKQNKKLWARLVGKSIRCP